MKAIWLAIAITPLLGGCLVASAAGAVVGVSAAAVGGAVDMVTTSKDEKNAKDAKRLRKENEELRDELEKRD